MISNKKIIITTAIIAAILIAIIGYLFYTYSLDKSKEEGKKIVSRAVVDSKWEPVTKTISSEKTISVDKNNTQVTNVQNTPVKAQDKVIKSGEFVSLDPLHYGKGSVSVIQNESDIKIAFSKDFETNPDGPDLYVWLVKKQEIKNIALGGVSSDPINYLDLGPLTAKSGSQIYQVTTSEFEANDYAVVIWCRAFGIQFSNAILK
jgi:Electron transfer DM13